MVLKLQNRLAEKIMQLRQTMVKLRSEKKMISTLVRVPVDRSQSREQADQIRPAELEKAKLDQPG